MSKWKDLEWNDGLDGVVASIEGSGRSLMVEGRRLIGAINKGEISLDQSIDRYVRFLEGEITESEIYEP